jgi:hypothetical protein
MVKDACDTCTCTCVIHMHACVSLRSHNPVGNSVLKRVSSLKPSGGTRSLLVDSQNLNTKLGNSVRFSHDLQVCPGYLASNATDLSEVRERQLVARRMPCSQPRKNRIPRINKRWLESLRNWFNSRFECTEDVSKNGSGNFSIANNSVRGDLGSFLFKLAELESVDSTLAEDRIAEEKLGSSFKVVARTYFTSSFYSCYRRKLVMVSRHFSPLTISDISWTLALRSLLVNNKTWHVQSCNSHWTKYAKKVASPITKTFPSGVSRICSETLARI